jgi:hypothetical protein
MLHQLNLKPWHKQWSAKPVLATSNNAKQMLQQFVPSDWNRFRFKLAWLVAVAAVT